MWRNRWCHPIMAVYIIVRIPLICVCFPGGWINLQPGRYLVRVFIITFFRSTNYLHLFAICVVSVFKRCESLKQQIQGSQGPSPSFGSFTSLDRPYEVQLKMMGRWHWSAWPVIIKLFNECTLDGAIYTVCDQILKKTWSAAVLVSRFWAQRIWFLNLMKGNWQEWQECSY